MSETVPEGWTKCKLSSVAVLEYGKSPNSVKDENGQFPIIGTSGLVGNATDFVWNKNSVVIGRKGTINKPIYINTPFWATDTTYFCKFFDKTHPKWFFYKICEEALEKHNEASGVPSLSRETLKSIQLTIPPLPEQKKIASILTSVDEVIETTQRQIDKLQDLKKATMNELLTKGIGHTEFKDSALGRIPKSWEVGRFDDFITLQRGHDLPVQERLDGEIPIYGSNGIVGYHISTSICEGGVITGRSGTIGDVHFEEGEYWALNTTLYVKAFHKNDKKFVFYFLNHFNLEQFSTGTGVPTLNRNDVHLQTVTFPDLVEQIQIRNILDKIEVYLNKKKLKLSQTQSLKKSLMQDLLTGKVRVQVN